MGWIVIAIIVAALIIAGAINKGESQPQNNFLDDYKPKSDDETRRNIIEEGLEKGQNAEEIAENLWFKTEENVLNYIKKYNLEDRYTALMEKRKKNPNLPTDIEIKKQEKYIEHNIRELKEYKDNFKLAKETHSFENALRYKGYIENAERTLKQRKQYLESLKSQKK